MRVTDKSGYNKNAWSEQFRIAHSVLSLVMRSPASLSLSLYLLPPLSFLSLYSYPFSFSPHVKFLRTLVASHESAFYRSQNDLAHVSYSSWRSGVGPDFPSPRFSLFFLATRHDSTLRVCGQHPSAAVTTTTTTATAAVASTFAASTTTAATATFRVVRGRRLAAVRLIDELSCESKATRGVASRGRGS